MSRRTLLLGLDGATFDVLDPLMADGVMPSLQKLTASGVRASLRSTVPALTPPAWTNVGTYDNPIAAEVAAVVFRKSRRLVDSLMYVSCNGKRGRRKVGSVYQ